MLKRTPVLVGEKTQKENVLKNDYFAEKFCSKNVFFPAPGVDIFSSISFLLIFICKKMEFCELALFRTVSFSKQIVLRTFRFLKNFVLRAFLFLHFQRGAFLDFHPPPRGKSWRFVSLSQKCRKHSTPLGWM